MILYRIIRNDGKGFVSGSDHHGNGPRFSDTGSFFRRPETIAQHLDNLCHEWEYVGWRQGDRSRTGGMRGWCKRVGKPDYSRLQNYRVQKLTVLASREDTLEALDFIDMVKRGKAA